MTIGFTEAGLVETPAPLERVPEPAAVAPRELTPGALLQVAAVGDRGLRLTRITAAIADAVTSAQVYEAIVDQVAAALGASSAALWLLSESDRAAGSLGSTARLMRAVGYAAPAKAALAEVNLEASPSLPLTDAMKQSRAIFIRSQSELLRLYPHLGPLVSHGRLYEIATLPLIVQGQALGVLGLSFDDQPPMDEDERNLLMLVARHSGQALERLRLFELERKSRARAELLYALARAVMEAESVDDVFAAALDAIEGGLGTRRSAILVFDDDVMRFKAWRGLSSDYRRAVEGHSPWPRDVRDPLPITVPDVQTDVSLRDYLPLFAQENIGALAFIPLVTQGRLVGKFMVYYGEARSLAGSELEMAQAIANHVAAAIARFTAVAELERTVRFSEMFTGILGHDLRNPLAAIMTAAQLALLKTRDEGLARPLSRIMNSGARMARMIDQLLDFTRARLGSGLSLEPRPLDLAALVQQVIDELDDAHPDWQLRLEHTGNTEGMWDSDRLLQVFSNLVANAVQHGVQAHGVTIRVDGRDPQGVRAEVWNLGAVPPIIVPRLFEPLAGGHRRRDRSQGLGLGLFITQQIVRAHGGRIDVTSTEAEGTTISVWLPRKTARE